MSIKKYFPFPPLPSPSLPFPSLQPTFGGRCSMVHRRPCFPCLCSPFVKFKILLVSETQVCPRTHIVFKCAVEVN